MFGDDLSGHWPWLSWHAVHVRKTDISLIIIQIETYKLGSLLTQERELGKNTTEATHGFSFRAPGAILLVV